MRHRGRGTVPGRRFVQYEVRGARQGQPGNGSHVCATHETCGRVVGRPDIIVVHTQDATVGVA